MVSTESLIMHNESPEYGEPVTEGPQLVRGVQNVRQRTGIFNLFPRRGAHPTFTLDRICPIKIDQGDLKIPVKSCFIRARGWLMMRD